MVSTDYKRQALRRLKRVAAAATPAISLLAALEALGDARFKETQSGRVLVGAAGNGQSVSFAVIGDITPVTQVELAEDLHRRYDEAKANLGGAPSDGQIFDEMMALLQPVRSVVNSYRSLRCGIPPVEAA